MSWIKSEDAVFNWTLDDRDHVFFLFINLYGKNKYINITLANTYKAIAFNMSIKQKSPV